MELFTPKLANSITNASKKGSCAKEMQGRLTQRDRYIVEEVKVTDPANATATVRDQPGHTAHYFLIKLGDQWRIRGIEPA